MRMPTRLNISWQSDEVLRVQSDAGADAPAAVRTEWDARLTVAAGVLRRRVGAARRRGAAAAAARRPRPRPQSRDDEPLEGWLRKNGVPYSEQTTLVEHWDRVAFPNGDIWLTVSQYVSDPKYLTREYTTSMHFKREPDGSKWKPAPCRQI